MPRWTSQPQQAVGIDTRHPRALGLVHDWGLNVTGRNAPGSVAVLDSAGSAHGVFGTGSPSTTTGNYWQPTDFGFGLRASDAGTGTTNSKFLNVGNAFGSGNSSASALKFTIAMWVKLTNFSAGMMLFDNPAAAGVSLRLNITTGTLNLTKSFTASLGNSTVALVAGKRQHIAVTHDGATARFWINGVDAGGAFADTTSFTNAGQVNLWASDAVNESIMWLPRVWNRGLRPDEVMADFLRPYEMYRPRADFRVGIVGGGTTYNQSVLASSSAIASLVRQTGKPLSANDNAVATLVRSTGKPLAQSSAAVGSLVRQCGKILRASSSAVATLTTSRQTLLSLQALASSLASLLKQTGKPLQASSPAIALLTRQTGKPLQATSPALASVTKRTGKGLAASSSAVATLGAIRATLLSLSVSSVAVASLARQIGKPLQAVSSAIATLTRQTAKSLVASSPAIASLSRQIAKTLRAVSSAVASLIAALAGTVQIVRCTVSDARIVTATASDARVVTATLSETVAPT